MTGRFWVVPNPNSELARMTSKKWGNQLRHVNLPLQVEVTRTEKCKEKDWRGDAKDLAC